MDEVISSLAHLRRRIVMQLFIERLAVCGLGFSALLVAVAAANVLRGSEPVNPWVATGMLAGVFLFAGAWTWVVRPNLAEAAAQVDRRASTRDRFLTAYDFLQTGSRTHLQQSAIEECRRFVMAFDGKAWTRFRMPRELPWLVVPIVAVALLTWHSNNIRARAAKGETTAATVAQSQELEKLAQTLDSTKSEDLKKIAEEIRKSEKRVKSANPGESRKAALKEMSSLESMIEDMMKSQGKTSPEEMKALIAALKKSELTKQAASALEAGKSDEAAKDLERVAKQQNPELSEAARYIQQALSQLAQNQKGDISKAMEKSSAGNQDKAGAASEALRRLAEMLRKAASNSRQSQGGQNQNSKEAMQNILSALQNMKYGNQQNQGQMNAGSKKGSPDPKAKMFSFTPNNGEGQQQQQSMALTNLPSGMPGSEHDVGTTKDPYGEQQKKKDTPAGGAQLNGQSGEGESLREFMTAAGDNSKASRGYRDLYNAMLPAAEEAVLQENIPLGSRFYIKRYFQNIRPKE